MIAVRHARVAIATLLAMAMVVFTGAPASAAPVGGVTPATAPECNTTAPCWVASTTGAGDTAVRYTWTFSTATTMTPIQVQFSVPAGTAGSSLTVGDAFGIGAASSVTLSGTTVSYSIASPVEVAVGTQILIAIDGFTNTATPGSYVSSVTIVGTGLQDGPTNSTPLTINPSTVTLNVTVAQVTTFSNNTSNISLNLNPTGTADASNTATQLNIATNAGFGYTITAEATPMTSQSGAVLQPITSGPSAAGISGGSFTTNRWGFTVASTTIGGNGAFSLASGITGGTYSGFPAAAQVIATQTGQTNSDLLAITTRAKIDLTQPAGTYRSTVTYTAIASY